MATSSAAPEHPHSIHVKIMSPSSGVPPDLAYHVPPTTSINALKRMIRVSLDSSPAPEQQRLIYRGKVLEGLSTLEDTLVDIQGQESHTLHLVISPHHSSSTPTLAAASGRSDNPATTAAFRPSFSRFSSTTTATPTHHQSGFTTTTVRTTHTSIISPRNSANPFEGLGTTGSTSRGEASLERLREELRNQRETLERLRREHTQAVNMAATGLDSNSSGSSIPGLNTAGGLRMRMPPSTSGTTSSTPPTRISETTLPNNPLHPILSTPEESIARNLEYMETLRRGPNPTTGPPPAFPRTGGADARRRALQDSLREMEQEGAGLFPVPLQNQPFNAPPAPFTFTQQIIPPNSLVYLLQDRFGRPHSLLVGPPGSASLYPILLNSGSALPNIIPNVAPPSYFTPSATAPPNIQVQPPAAAAAAPPNILNPPQNPPENANDEFNFPGQEHIWVALRLIFFFWAFAAGSSFPVRFMYFFALLGIFFWQTGLLNNHLRPLIDAINPPPPPGLQPPQPPNPLQQQQRADPQQPLDPAVTARMLINRRQDGVRNTVRNAERAAMVFVGSLVPWWHDRYVARMRAQQQAEEAATALLEQRQREQEERQQREQEERRQQQQQHVQGSPPAPTAEPEVL